MSATKPKVTKKPNVLPKMLFNSGEGMTWDMKDQGSNASAYYTKLKAVKADVRQLTAI